MIDDNYFRTYVNPGGGIVLYHVWSWDLGDDGMYKVGVYNNIGEVSKAVTELGLEKIPMYIQNQMDNIVVG